MSEDTVLRKIIQPKGGEVTEGWRGFHNECSSLIIRSIKSRIMRCLQHVAHRGKTRNANKI
jgi:hypothetical protein